MIRTFVLFCSWFSALLCTNEVYINQNILLFPFLKPTFFRQYWLCWCAFDHRFTFQPGYRLMHQSNAFWLNIFQRKTRQNKTSAYHWKYTTQGNTRILRAISAVEKLTEQSPLYEILLAYWRISSCLLCWEARVMRLMKTVLNIEIPVLHVRIAYHRNRSHSSIAGRTTGTGAVGRQGVCNVGSQQSDSEPSTTDGFLV